MKLFVTGGAGFIGSHFIHYVLREHPEDSIVNFDALTYAGNLANLKDIESHPRYSFVRGDICDAEAVRRALSKGCDGIVNFAAETHVDRSILDPDAFIRTDVFGTRTLLESVREQRIPRYVQISTDEVYGDVPAGQLSQEEDLLRPSSPYAASKAAGDLMVLAYVRTWNVPAVVTRCTNNYGPNMYPEKFISLAVTNVLEEKAIPVYGDGKQIRDWLYVEDHCRGIDLALRRGRNGEIYNFAANNKPDWTNLDIVDAILAQLGKGEEYKSFVKDREGHDRRYAVNCEKAKRELGWSPTIPLAGGLQKTVQWYVDNPWWWKPLKDGSYQVYYEKQYSSRMSNAVR